MKKLLFLSTICCGLNAMEAPDEHSLHNPLHMVNYIVFNNSIEQLDTELRDDVIDDYETLILSAQKKYYWNEIFQINDFINKFPEHVTIKSESWQSYTLLGGLLKIPSGTTKSLYLDVKKIPKELALLNFEKTQHQFLLSLKSPAITIGNNNRPVSEKNSKKLSASTIALGCIAIAGWCCYKSWQKIRGFCNLRST